MLPRVAGAAGLGALMRAGSPGSPSRTPETPPLDQRSAHRPAEPLRDEGTIAAPEVVGGDATVGRAVAKARDFDRSYDDDIWIEDERWDLLVRTAARLDRSQRYHRPRPLQPPRAFRTLLAFGRSFHDIGDFETDEIELLEELFQADARRYGFLGEKTDHLARGRATGARSQAHRRAPATGCCRAPRSRSTSRSAATSATASYSPPGVRGLAKQYHLFLTKAVATQGNLSQAARSLAPPGYSFHAVGDFDIGKLGLGSDNFTDRFAETDEFKKLIDLGYVDIRYSGSQPLRRPPRALAHQDHLAALRAGTQPPARAGERPTRRTRGEEHLGSTRGCGGPD